MTYRENRNNPERSKELMILPDGVKRKLDGVVDSSTRQGLRSARWRHDSRIM